MIVPDSIGPFSRPYLAARLPTDGTRIEILANPEECRALAADLGLEALGSLAAWFRITAIAGTLRVRGRVTADVTQTCVVTLEPFDTRLDEEVEVDFIEASPERPRVQPGEEIDIAEDGPDEIVDGRVDLGSLAAEFLALGLAPFPRKPGIEFAYTEDAGDANPFAKLASLKAKA